MKCPFCHQENDRVVDTRTSDDGFVVRRRRSCCLCNKKFTTYERVETTLVRVVKRDGMRVPFDRDKLRRGLERACWKRPVSDTQISTLIAQVEGDIDSSFETEVESRFIGERVMHYLRDLDQVAYVRFASVYWHFKNAQDFAQAIGEMLANPDSDFPKPNQAANPKTKFRIRKSKKTDKN